MKRSIAWLLLLALLAACACGWAEDAQDDEEDVLIQELTPQELELWSQYQFDYLYDDDEEHHVFELRIAPHMADMTASVDRLGERETEYGVSYRYALTLYETIRPEVSPQVLEYESTESARWSVWAVEDFNFDGYLDLVICRYTAATNQVLDVFLWNAASAQYERFDLGACALSWHTLYSRQRLIYNEVHDSLATGRTELYTFENGALVLVRSTVTEYDDADESKLWERYYDYTGGARRMTYEASTTLEQLAENYDAIEQRRLDFLFEGYDLSE